MMTAKKKPSLDEIKQDLASAMLKRLCGHPLSDIDHDQLSTDTGHDAALTRRLYPDLTECIDQGLKDIDDHIASQLAEDFSEDDETETRGRILEGLIVRAEAYTPYKQAIKHLNKASMLNPLLAQIMINRLSKASQVLLELAGLDTTGLRGLIRIKGLAGVALSVQRDWFLDDTTDCAMTIRALDNRLKQAEDIAEMFNIISPQPSDTNHEQEDKTDDRNPENDPSKDNHDV